MKAAELPVIPKARADTIEEYKANHYRLSEIFTEWNWNYDSPTHYTLAITPLSNIKNAIERLNEN